VAARKSIPPGVKNPAKRSPRIASGRRKAAPERSPSYHHGDLRNALLSATEALLNETGLEGFTLREVARRAGVSHGAPAHHFGDAKGLLSEFTADSFTQLAAAMAAHRVRAEPRGFEQLVATGVGYIDYALGHRARFQLMFRSDRLDHANPRLADSAGRAYAHLVDCIAAIGREIKAPQYRLAEKTALAWSLVHGFSNLMIDNRNFAAQAEGDVSRALLMAEAMLMLSRPAFEEAGRKR
jgi:AcrR family transcriptional regulator